MQQRLIKFRAWDDALKAYAKFQSGSFHTKDRPGEEQFYSLVPGPEDLQWEQFTGLLDKNGKEIYEGDVLRASGNHNLGGQGAVVFHAAEYALLDGNDYIEFTENGDTSLGNTALVAREVIGNIHENPELLSASKADTNSSTS